MHEEPTVRYSTQIKPISYVKAHAADLIRRVNDERQPIIITQNGEARAVLVDVHTYEEQQEQLALLQMLAMGRQEVDFGHTHAFADAAQSIRQRLERRKEEECAAGAVA